MLHFSVLLLAFACPTLLQNSDQTKEISGKETSAEKPSISGDAEIDKLAIAFARILASNDDAAFASEVFITFGESGSLEYRRLADAGLNPRKDRLPESEAREYYDEAVGGVRAEFGYLYSSLCREGPAVPPDGVKVVGVRTVLRQLEAAPEDKELWTEELFELEDAAGNLMDLGDDFFTVTLEVRYPSSASLLYEVNLHVVQMDAHWSILEIEEDLNEVPSALTGKFASQVAEALILGDKQAFEQLYVDEQRAKWYLEHRASQKVRDLFIETVLVPDKASMTELFHLGREALEQEGIEHGAKILDVQHDMYPVYRNGVTHRIESTIEFADKDGNTRRIVILQEAMHGGQGLYIPAKANTEVNLLDAEIDSQGEAYGVMQPLLATLDRFRKPSEHAANLERADELLAGLEALNRVQQIRGLTTLAMSYADRHETAGEAADPMDLLRSMELFDRAQKLKSKDNGVGWTQPGRLEGGDRAVQLLNNLATKSLDIANRKREQGADAQETTPYYAATALAGSLYQLRGSRAAPAAFVRISRIAAEQYQDQGKHDLAYDVLRRFFLLKPEMATMDLAAMMKETRCSQEVLFDGYQRLAILLFNQSVDILTVLNEIERPRPALKIRGRQRAEAAKFAFQIAQQMAPEVPIAGNRLESCDQLIEALR